MSKGGFIEFREALGMLESSGNYSCYKAEGPYFGKYQFGPARLQDLGLRDPDREWVIGLSDVKFLANSALQDATFVAHVARHLDAIYRRYAAKFGSDLSGVTVTPSGLVGAAHLVGLGAVNRMLRTGIIPADGNGTRATKYMRILGDYDIPLEMPQTVPQELIF